MVLKKRRRLVLLQDTNFHIRLLQDAQIVVIIIFNKDTHKI